MVFLRLTSPGAFAKMNLQRFKTRRKRGGMKSMFQVVKRDGEIDNFRIDKIKMRWPNPQRKKMQFTERHCNR